MEENGTSIAGVAQCPCGTGEEVPAKVMILDHSGKWHGISQALECVCEAMRNAQAFWSYGIAHGKIDRLTQEVHACYDFATDDKSNDFDLDVQVKEHH